RQQRVNLAALDSRVELAILEGAQRQMIAASQLERGSRDLIVGPDLGGIAGWKRRRTERTQTGLRVGRPELAGDAPQPTGIRRAGEEEALVGVADDFQRHRFGGAFSS